MGTTLSTTPKTNGVYTIDEINAVFDEIASVLNNKVDKTVPSVLNYTTLDMGGKQVLNVPDPVSEDSLVPYSLLLSLAGGA